MHTHSLSINSDPGRALRPWELALLLAVCVTLGAGAGHNWWCVIFPPLCAQAAGLSEQAVQALSDDDVRLVTESDGGYVVRFRLLELWDALVQRLS